MLARWHRSQPAPRACPVGAWRDRVRLGKLSLYCVNGQTSELVAAPVPAGGLSAPTITIHLTP
jgi:hypothetical protein